jgi:uncharacterized membrane protein YkoI
MRQSLHAAALLLVLLGGAAAADDDSHDRAREALDRGEIAPLDQILAEVRRQGLGTVLEVELERHDGRWVYEVETLSPEGVIAKTLVDAKSPRQRLPAGEHEDD